MAKKQKAIRGKFADEKYLGSEPDLRGDVSNAQIISAYNWYNYFYDAEQAKAWVIDYLKEFHKQEKELIKNVSRIDSNYCRTSGWNCRILSLGGDLPEDIRERNESRIRTLAAAASGADSVHGESNGEANKAKEASREEEEVNPNARGTSHAGVADNCAGSGNMANGIYGTKASELGTGSQSSDGPTSKGATRKGPGSRSKSNIAGTTQGNRGENGGDESSAGLHKIGIGSDDEEVSGRDSNPSTNSGAEAGNTEEAQENTVRHSPQSTVISIQERIANRTNELIADIEVELDKFYRNGTQFKMGDWLNRYQVKPQIAQRIADHYKPLYSEVFDAFEIYGKSKSRISEKEEQLQEAYSRWKKSKLKDYVEFLRSIISAAEARATVAKASRKPRKKKEKPASALVSKLKYKVKDETFKLDSIDPKQIIGCNQLWVFNTKYRTLGVYNAMGPAGLSVKGSSVTGWDEKTSLIKTLRKPDDQLKKLLEGGKIVLRKFMDDIKCKPKAATGRINSETVIVRIIK